MSKLLGLKVDLVSKDALKPRIGEQILKEVIDDIEAFTKNMDFEDFARD